MVATTGGSSRKPSAVALLEVDSVDDLLKAKPDQWQMIRLSTKSQVSLMTVNPHVFYSLLFTGRGIIRQHKCGPNIVITPAGPTVW